MLLRITHWEHAAADHSLGASCCGSLKPWEQACIPAWLHSCEDLTGVGEHAWIQDERDGILAWILLVWVSMLGSKMSVISFLRGSYWCG